MISEVIMPQMGADMKEGTILHWLKAEGDQVNRGEVVAEIETDKANVEIEAFEGGVFRKVIASEGETVAVGDVIAIVAGPDEDISSYEAKSEAPAAAQQPADKTPAAAQQPAEKAPTAAEQPAEKAPAAQQPAEKAPAAQQPAEKAPAAQQPGEKAPAAAEQPAEAPTAAQPAGEKAPAAEEPAEKAAQLPAEKAPAAAEQPAQRTPAAQPSAQPHPARINGHVRASPVARRLAEEFGIDLTTVEGTGPDGRIVKRDVEAARGAAPSGQPAGRPTAEKDVVQDIPLSRMREAIARHMQQSKQTAPHYYLTDDVDMTEAMHMRAQINESLDESERVSVNDLILLATARALLEHPRFNAHWVEDHLQLHSQVNLGIAVALDDGLVAPAIIDCGRKGLKQIAGEARAVAERARDGRLSPEEYSAPTFTVSNLGAFGVDVLVPIINPPQVGILGIGAVREKPVVRNGEVIVRQMMSVVLASDHRATDGAEGARFLATLRQYLEVPGLLLG